MDIWVVPTFWLLRIMLPRVFTYKLLSGHVFVSFGFMSRGGVAGLQSNSVFNILRNCQTVCIMNAPFSTPTSGA